jgi:hypothetical protein
LRLSFGCTCYAQGRFHLFLTPISSIVFTWLVLVTIPEALPRDDPLFAVLHNSLGILGQFGLLGHLGRLVLCHDRKVAFVLVVSALHDCSLRNNKAWLPCVETKDRCLFCLPRSPCSSTKYNSEHVYLRPKRLGTYSPVSTSISIDYILYFITPSLQ